MAIRPLCVGLLIPFPTQLAHPTLVVISERLLEMVKMCEIRSEIYGASDHCPIVLEIDDTFGDTDETKTTDTVSTINIIAATDPSAA
jgi:hypothetical protein